MPTSVRRGSAPRPKRPLGREGAPLGQRAGSSLFARPRTSRDARRQFTEYAKKGLAFGSKESMNAHARGC